MSAVVVVVVVLLFYFEPIFLFGFVDMHCSVEAQIQRREKPFLSSLIAVHNCVKVV